MKTLINKDNPQIRITAPAIDIDCLEDYYRIPGVALLSNKVWTLVEEEPKHTEVWVEGRTIFEQEGEPTEGIKGNLEEIPSNVDLEKAAEEYADKHGFRVSYDGSNNFYDDVDVKASLEGFKAGAKWMEEQMKGDSK